VIDRDLIEGVDYYVENGLFVFTAEYLRERGYCCTSGCRHCPYGFRREPLAANTPAAPKSDPAE
jgi:hypothetical protein